MVATKRGNQRKGTPWSDGRAGAWVSGEGTMNETLNQDISTKLERMAVLAQRLPISRSQR